MKLCVHAQSCLTLCGPWTVNCQGPLSMEISRQECWSRLPFPSPRDLSPPKDQAHISCISCVVRWILFQLSHQGSHTIINLQQITPRALWVSKVYQTDLQKVLFLSLGEESFFLFFPLQNNRFLHRISSRNWIYDMFLINMFID